MTLYLDITTTVHTDDGQFSSMDRNTRVAIEINHEAEWDMPDGLTYDQQQGISDVMSKWIAERFDVSDFNGDPDEYYDTRDERRSA